MKKINFTIKKRKISGAKTVSGKLYYNDRKFARFYGLSHKQYLELKKRLEIGNEIAPEKIVVGEFEEL